jgi:hypothetical protein
MQRDIVIRRVMTKFTQIPQCSEELRMCFNKDTRRNGIMTPLKNGIIYIVTTLIGLAGGLITVLKVVVPLLVKLVRRKTELPRQETGKIK